MIDRTDLSSVLVLPGKLQHLKRTKYQPLISHLQAALSQASRGLAEWAFCRLQQALTFFLRNQLSVEKEALHQQHYAIRQLEMNSLEQQADQAQQRIAQAEAVLEETA